LRYLNNRLLDIKTTREQSWVVFAKKDLHYRRGWKQQRAWVTVRRFWDARTFNFTGLSAVLGWGTLGQRSLRRERAVVGFVLASFGSGSSVTFDNKSIVLINPGQRNK
jgi:hypothetical protein